MEYDRREQRSHCAGIGQRAAIAAVGLGLEHISRARIAIVKRDSQPEWNRSLSLPRPRAEARVLRVGESRLARMQQAGTAPTTHCSRTSLEASSHLCLVCFYFGVSYPVLLDRAGPAAGTRGAPARRFSQLGQRCRCSRASGDCGADCYCMKEAQTPQTG